MPIMYTIALDLEGTLISNAISVFPRPHLHAFLVRCKTLSSHIVLFTSVSTERARWVLRCLAEEGSAPDWFASIPIIDWEGDKKDLCFIPGCDPQHTLLLDDQEAYILPSQHEQWMYVPAFDAPYPGDDDTLLSIASILEERCRRQT